MPENKEKLLRQELLDTFLIANLINPKYKRSDVKSIKKMIAEANKAKRANRELSRAFKKYLLRCDDGVYINYRAIFIAFLDHLGDNIPLSEHVEKELKLAVDYTKLNKRNKLKIRLQAVAQFIALEDPRKRVSQIRNEIIWDHRLDRLLAFKTFPSLNNPEKTKEDRYREIDNIISEVIKWSVGRPTKDAHSTVVISPLVYSNGKVNFQALLAVMSAVGSVLKVWSKPFPKDFDLSVIDLYKKALPPSSVINDFIDITIITYYMGRGSDEYYD